MFKICKHIYTFIWLSVFFSCSEDLISIQSQNKEKVNGFELTWRRNVTPEQKNIVRELLSNMIFVEGGTFVMGATPEQTEFARVNEYPLSYVKLSDYYICKYEISDEQYLNFIPHDTNISYLSLSRKDWEVFINILREISGITFDLPTESQWEYAARGGIYSKGYIYPGSNVLEDVWSDSKTEGSSCPNELGIYNMADLRSECCKDCYEEYVSTKFWYDRYIKEGDKYVIRGGNYHCSGYTSKYNNEQTTISTHHVFGHYRSAGSMLNPYDYRYCRTTARSYYWSSNSSQHIGCRLVINIKQ